MALAILYLSSYVAAVAAAVFVTTSLGGLLWLAEVIEEHSRLAKIIGQRAIWAIIAFHILLIFDTLPVPHLIFSILCHIVYSLNMTPEWPSISLTSPVFILSCIMVLVDHFLWFFYFSNQHQLARQRNRAYGYRGGSYSKNKPGVENDRSFSEIATFFAICVWTVPLFLFLSLSANDNALPIQGGASDGSIQGYAGSGLKQKSLLRRLLSPAISLLPSLRGKKREEGIIAPSSPSPYPPSPGFHGAAAQTSYNSPGVNQLSGSWASVAGAATSSRPSSPVPGIGLGIASNDSVYMGSPPAPRARRVLTRRSGSDIVHKND